MYKSERTNETDKIGRRKTRTRRAKEIKEKKCEKRWKKPANCNSSLEKM